MVSFPIVPPPPVENETLEGQLKKGAWEGDRNSVINTMINPYSSLVHTCVVYILTPVTAMPIAHLSQDPFNSYYFYSLHKN